MSSSSEVSHTDSGKFTARGETNKALHCGHLLLYGYLSNKRQVKKPKRLVGKIYNKRQVDYSHSSMSEEDNNFDDDFDDEEFGEESEDEFGDEEAGAKLYPIPRFHKPAFLYIKLKVSTF